MRVFKAQAQIKEILIMFYCFFIIVMNLGTIRYRMEVWIIETDQKYAQNNNGSITYQPDNNVALLPGRPRQRQR